MTKKQKKTKHLTKKEQQQLKELKKNIFFCTLLCLLVLGLSYFIFITDVLKPSLNEMTASYISFNNSNTTDMLKISDLEKMPDDKGKSSSNNKSLDFEVTGSKNSTYEVIIYPINKNNDLENIKYYLTENDKVLTYDTLDKKEVSQDGGIIIYQGKITKNNNLNIRMWLSKKYHQSTANLSFEIKVKPR